MNDIELLELMKKIDPQSVRVPPGVRKIIEAAILFEREECAAICDRFAEREMHPAECAGAIRMRSNAIIQGLERSDSPTGMEG